MVPRSQKWVKAPSTHQSSSSVELGRWRRKVEVVLHAEVVRTAIRAWAPRLVAPVGAGISHHQAVLLQNRRKKL